MASVSLSQEQLLSLHSLPSYDYTMASQAHNIQTPVTGSTDSSAQVDYFTSTLSSTTTSSRTSVEIQDRTVVTPGGTVTTSSAHLTKNPLPPLSRDFPKPTAEIDVEEALSRKPGRWTVRGAIAVERPVQVVDEEKIKAQRRKALEDAKKELFAASEALKNVPLPPRKNNF
ncbi:hypothetical protein CORC01_10063 [Colletotrichum orchidophilum]|uniref:Uncharacterized protein n=1 Tax=Colletotrichum orchidophilum TaxID=1209926 RepID=A0A1G4B036_9PEZI|nr:uncharacterized protein CORC01_10063 [Colletotrichum orchidophilum]OHE94662.1 hypothetical protein CORC01_10063 [Colletotrichum orchidophilum]